jgi:hypothetical protein
LLHLAGRLHQGAHQAGSAGHAGNERLGLLEVFQDALLVGLRLFGLAGGFIDLVPGVQDGVLVEDAGLTCPLEFGLEFLQLGHDVHAVLDRAEVDVARGVVLVGDVLATLVKNSHMFLLGTV